MTQEILICYDGSREAERAIDAAAAFLVPRAGLAAEARGTIASTTWQGIVDVADELDVAAIVIGSRALHGFRGFARGSVSHDVGTYARRPVLIVPPVTT